MRFSATERFICVLKRKKNKSIDWKTCTAGILNPKNLAAVIVELITQSDGKKVECLLVSK